MYGCFTRKNFIVTKRDFARVLITHFQCQMVSGNAAFSLVIVKLFKILRCFLPKCMKLTNQQVETLVSAHVGVTRVPESIVLPLFLHKKDQQMNLLLVVLFPVWCHHLLVVSIPVASQVQFQTHWYSVAAGLVLSNLADILATTDELQTKPKRRVFKAKVLTEQELYDTLIKKEHKEKAME